MKYSIFKNIVLPLILLFVVGCSQVQKNNSASFENIYICDAETVDRDKWKFAEKESKSQFFGNVEAHTKDTSFSGEHSLKLTPTNQYGFTTELNHVGGDEYIQVTVWRKNENINGIIVIDGGEGFYNAGKNIIDEKQGWQKIYLEVSTPPTFFNRKIKIFTWNNSQDSVYFDDMQIIHRNKKIYPEYNGIPSLQIHADISNINKFNQKRLQAFETTVLVNSDEDYANMVLFDGNDFLNGSFRLKGDLVDHLQGQKWSFRIKLKKEFAWKNIRTFSIQNPSTRNFLHEWLAHKIFEQEDVLTTRYGFIPVKINNESLGIYAWEEHFEKHLIESSNRREGPIIRFDESLFWQRVLETKVTNREWNIDYFGASKIIPFKASKTTADSLLTQQLVQAQNLLLQYKNQARAVSEIFDIDKLANYYALIDVTQAYHGFTWHNQRFYYNPITCLLEPIAFDGYIEGGIYKRIDEQVTGLLNPGKIESFNKEELMLFQVFSDSVFNQKYIGALKKYSSSQFIETLISQYKTEVDSLSNLINKEFPYYQFNFNFLKWQSEYIQNNIDEIKANIENLGLAVAAINPEKFRKEFTSDVNKNLIPFQVHAFYNEKQKQVHVLNYHNSQIKILGAFMSNRLPESFEPRPELEAYKGVAAPEISISVDGVPIKILFSVNNEMFETEVSQWAYSNGSTYRQILFSKSNPDNLPIVGDSIVFDGNYRFETDVIIPASAKVIFMPGTIIDLVNGSGFFSFSPLKIEGTETNPIKIISSDKSANGFNVLQASGRSQLKYVYFSGLSNLRRGGWQTPSAITFYEADVNMENCVIADNSNCDDALNIVRSDFLVSNCRFENTFADAFDSDFCTGTVQNCLFQNTGNDAIDFSGSHVEISDCKMIDIKDKAISGGENSKLIVTNCEIEKANIGVAAKDLSSVVLNKIIMDQTVYGLVAFVKKPEYGSASITIDNLKMKNNMVFHQIELGSVLTLNGKTIYGREKKLAIKLYQ